MLPCSPNPIWTALTTRQRGFAVESPNGVLRFDPEIAPFAAVDSAAATVAADEVLEHGTVHFAGMLPKVSGRPARFTEDAMYQMAFVEAAPLPPEPHPDETELGIGDSAAMLALIREVYPGYFRPKTPLLGRYVGIWREGSLVAMAGERLRVPGCFEISGVCTRAAYAGRGYARHLIHRLLHRVDERPILHVGCSNARARQLYESMGFAIAAKIPLLKIEHLE